MFKVFIYLYIFLESVLCKTWFCLLTEKRRGLWSCQLWGGSRARPGLRRSCLAASRKAPARAGGASGPEAALCLPSTPGPSHPDPHRTPVPACQSQSSCRGCPGDWRESAALTLAQQGRTPSRTPGLGWAGQTQRRPAPAHLRGCSGGRRGHSAEH